MATSPTSKSAPLSGAAKDDAVGLNGDYTFTIQDLLGNDPGGAAKISGTTQFFFGDAPVGGGLPTIDAQKAYLALHGITANEAFTEFTIGAGATDITYMVQIGNKGTWSTADVDVTAPEPVVEPEPHAGDLLFSEDFDTYANLANLSHGSWDTVNLTRGPETGPSVGHSWAIKEGDQWVGVTGEVVQGNLPGSIEFHLWRLLARYPELSRRH